MPVVNHTESPMSRPPLLVVVLAAGQGTRMKSALPKAQAIGANALSVVVGPGMETVQAEALSQAPGAKIHVQEQQRGTADAVLAARDALKGHNGDVLVLYADTPLLTAEALERLRARLDDGAGICVLGFEAADPMGYGRLLIDGSGFLN